MISSILKKVITAGATFVIAISLGTSMAQAAESPKGNVTINVVDQYDRPMTGLWFLKAGSTDKGRTVRNGANGETFKVDTGTYYLVAYNVDKTSTREVIGENPQVLTEGGNINYTIKYTREAGYNTATQNSNYKVSADIIEKAKKRTSTTPVSNKQKISGKSATVSPTTTSTDSSSVTVSSSPAAYVDAPDFTDAPASSTKVASTPFRLAQTGPAATLPLLLASVFGFFALPKKRKG